MKGKVSVCSAARAACGIVPALGVGKARRTQARVIVRRRERGHERVQVKPYASLRMADMAQAFGAPLPELQAEVVQLVVERAMPARVDAHNQARSCCCCCYCSSRSCWRCCCCWRCFGRAPFALFSAVRGQCSAAAALARATAPSCTMPFMLELRNVRNDAERWFDLLISR
jgi:hypothetical protein